MTIGEKINSISSYNNNCKVIINYYFNLPFNDDGVFRKLYCDEEYSFSSNITTIFNAVFGYDWILDIDIDDTCSYVYDGDFLIFTILA